MIAQPIENQAVAPNFVRVVVAEGSHSKAVDVFTSLPDVEVVEKVHSFDDCVLSILNTGPDIILMDTSFPPEQWRKICNELNSKPFETIFISSDLLERQSANKFGFFSVSSRQELLQVLMLVKEKSERLRLEKRLEALTERFNLLNRKTAKILLGNSSEVEVFEVQEIVRCQANGNYTDFYFRNSRKKRICKPIRAYEPELEPLGIVRVNKSHMVNIDQVRSILHGTEILMSDTTRILLSINYREKFSKLFEMPGWEK